LLSESASDKLNDEEKEYLSHIQDANMRMKTLIDDLLNLFRIRQRKTELSLTDLSKIALECIENQKHRFPRLKIEYSIQPQMSALADAGMMRILYENLIGNAVKYSSKSDIVRIDVGCKKKNSHSIYYVRDYGAGFEGKKLRIFLCHLFDYILIRSTRELESGLHLSKE
jgi:light-regulated signal transduction histidine kinase (bacteriophytochrome)